MAFNDGPHPALLQDNVLENILEYAASGEPYRNTSNLRSVCKQWREMSFKGLCQSSSLPAIGLRDNKNRRGGHEIKFKTFIKHFPKTCPTYMALSEPRLPIQMKISRLPLPEDVADIQEFSRYITSIRIFAENRFNENVTYDFKLPNLRSIEVWWETKNLEPWQRLVNYVLDASNCDVVLKYVMRCYDRNQPSTWPVALQPLRELEWNGLAMDLQRFTTPTLKQLVTLKIMLDTSDPSVESAALTEILARHSSTLQIAEISHSYFSLPPFKTLKLPLGPLPQLLTLESSVPILLSKDKWSPKNLPKLKNLKYIVGNHSLEESDGFQVSHVVSNSLVKLCWRWRSSLAAEQKDQEETNREKEIVREFLEEQFPVYPELMELNIDNMPFCVAHALMPKVYNFMTNLTCLSLDFVQKPGTISSSGDETDDLHKILTGRKSADYPVNPTLWPGFLKDNKNAITSLKHLTNLRIHRRESLELVFGRFLFYAVFFQLRKLTVLKLSGSLLVEWDMINEWESAGREIHAAGV